jgi:transposase
MDDNARPHRARIVQHLLQQDADQTIPWPSMSPDMNPIEHVGKITLDSYAPTPKSSCAQNVVVLK